ncbi:Vacuolar protein-sorting-associated protein 28 [Malassezia japonica]|uniref:Vacuolar protein sorting-associated protein 28 n=1 Tax=Malassezia japonica TaxID=223818 RepID=A0AAF0F1Z6_9BASI|nr:Vacuolar protein-sorting-associated protein 28 [Malassezia japonica]WFD38306.1 Vacuolar protein-sorting-associated protein 28 [Malassezia japonica]
MNVFEEQRLYHTSQERENYESMATLFSLISCLDFLERAYVRGAIGEDEYTPACARLLGQYKTVIKLITDPTKPAPFRFDNIEAFMAYYDMDYPAAAHRLQLGVPATVEHASESKPHAAVHAQLVAETTQNFITLMDALKLKMRAKDQLHPLLSDLLSAYTKVGAADGEAREKLLAWLITLNKLSASEEVDETAAREMLFDIEHAYTTWFKSLQGS